MKRVLVVGATSGIAMECLRIWAKEGASLFLVARDAAKLEALANDLSVRGARAAHVYRMDSNDTPAHAGMLDAAKQTLGELDIALLAHGTLPDQQAAEADVALALREIATNYTSIVALLTSLANQFERQRHGAICVITSVAGDRGRPTNYVYGSAKAGVQVFCEGLRARLFRAGVALTDIRPGFVATPMTAGLSLPAPLVAKAEDVARRIVSGIERRKDVIYAPAYWAMIMLVIRSIPRFVFKRLKL